MPDHGENRGFDIVESFEELLCLCVPQLQVLVVRGGGQERTIGGPSGGCDVCSMPCLEDALPCPITCRHDLYVTHRSRCSECPSIGVPQHFCAGLRLRLHAFDHAVDFLDHFWLVPIKAVHVDVAVGARDSQMLALLVERDMLDCAWLIA